MVSETTPAAPAGTTPLAAGEVALFADTIAPLARATLWICACGVFNGVLAVLLGLTIIGLPFAAALAWVAFLEFRAASRLDAARLRPAAPDGIDQAAAAVNDIALHYIVQAVITTLMIVAALVALALFAPLLGKTLQI
ncbi:MAG TPA: hypothetical protein VND63_05740 [Rhodanobacteraceae bacterium]|nr:hypothetical protein [Rhodanobacteraceae bacterium]